MIQYEVICQHGNKMPRIYRTEHLELARQHAKDVKGFVKDRITKEIIFDYRVKK